MIRTRHPFRIVALVTAFALAGAAHAQTATTVAGSTPGGVGIVQAVDAAAMITAIDAVTRAFTLKGLQDRELSIVAGPAASRWPGPSAMAPPRPGRARCRAP